MPGGGHADRLNAYKNKGKDSEELRRRRNEVSVELRRNKREDALSKRRNVVVDDDDDVSGSGGLSPLKERQNNTPAAAMTLEEVKEGLFSSSPEVVFQATHNARKMLSKERNPPIDAMIEAGLVPKLVDFLKVHSNPALQFEAAWALTNIASGTSTQTKCVANEPNAVSYFVKLLSSEDANVCEQAVWALGNIAGDGPVLRDAVINAGILKPLISLAESSSVSDSFLSNITWTVSNLCRNKNPSPPMIVATTALPVIVNKLVTHSDRQIITDACWALSYLTDGDNEKIEEVVKSGAVATLVRLLDCGDAQIVTPSLRALGNVVTGTDEQTDSVLQAEALPVFGKLLMQDKMSLVKEAAWAISNITAGNQLQIQRVVDAGILHAIVHVLKDGDSKAQKEAAWAVTNLTSGGTLEQMVALCQSGPEGALKPMCDLLAGRDVKTVVVILEGLANILAAAEKAGEVDTICTKMEECEGLDKIENLQTHENEDVYKKAYHIIETYFCGDEEGDEVEQDGDQFKFSNPQATSENNAASATGNGYSF